MRLSSVFGIGLSLVAAVTVVASPVGEPTEPEIVVVATFPESNPLQHVTNGQRNEMVIGLENKSNKNVTVSSITGAILHPTTGKLIKNTTTSKYEIPLIEGARLQLPYEFFSEVKTGDKRLQIWVEHVNGDEKYLVEAFNSIVTVVEPTKSVFDIQLLLTYLITLGLIGGAGFVGYTQFYAPPKPKRVRTQEVSEPVGIVTATGAGGYQEEWIPDHHLKKKAAGRKQASGALTSGDETSGNEASGTETRKRGKGRK